MGSLVGHLNSSCLVLTSPRSWGPALVLLCYPVLFFKLLIFQVLAQVWTYMRGEFLFLLPDLPCFL